MIQANELRLGNWVYSQEIGENVQVTELNEDSLSFGCATWDYPTYEEIHPIQLTEEILLKCGAERLSNRVFANFFRLHLKRNKYLIISDLGTPNLMIGIIEVDIDSNKIEDCVNVHNWDYEKEIHLHQLQNLFYSLKGQELEIKL